MEFTRETSEVSTTSSIFQKKKKKKKKIGKQTARRKERNGFFSYEKKYSERFVKDSYDIILTFCQRCDKK